MMLTQSSILRQIARKCSASVALCRPISWTRALAAASSCLSAVTSLQPASRRYLAIMRALFRVIGQPNDLGKRVQQGQYIVGTVKGWLTAQPLTGLRPRQIANKCIHAFTQIVERWSARLPRRERLERVVLVAHLLDARLGRRQLLPQRGNLGCRGRGAVDHNRLH